MKVKRIEVCALVFLLMQCCIFGFTINASVTVLENNAWIAPIVGSIIGFGILLLYLYIYNYKPDMNINELNIDLFGNKFGKLLNSILIACAVVSMVVVFAVLTNFISSQFLYNTPPLFIEFLFIIVVIYVLNHGLEPLFRTILIIFYIVILVHIVNDIGLIRQAKITNLMPFFNTDIKSVIVASFNYISFTILPIFFLLIVPRNKIENKKLDKSIIYTYIFTNVAILIIMFMLISIFGANLASLYSFPGYHLLKQVFEGAMIERFENVLSMYWLLIMFFSITFLAYYILKSMKDNFKLKKNGYLIIIGLLYINNYIFRNDTDAKNWIEHIFPIIMYIALLGVPLIMFVRILQKKD